jgi:hypothetical protein
MPVTQRIGLHLLISQGFSGGEIGLFLAGTENWTEKRRVFLRDEPRGCGVSECRQVRRLTSEWLDGSKYESAFEESTLQESALEKSGLNTSALDESP